MQGKARQSNRARLRVLRSAKGRKPIRCFGRRGTALVYVLGVLTLVALIGVILIARTHGEFKRVSNEATASSGRAAMGGVIRVVQEMLHRDIWGPDGQEPTPLSNMTTSDLRETNEPYDAPGEDDRWLASNYPHVVIDENDDNPGYGLPAPQFTGFHTDSSWDYEPNVLAWHRVSYLGTDIIRTALTTPFAWAVDSRTDAPASIPEYSDGSLEDVQILQTPIPGWENVALIPGSTTNVTIAEARAIWQGSTHQANLAAVLGTGVVPRFPYFDTNGDGIVDLYDADGDGVPDSPISFVVPQDNTDPDAPKRLYAVIRIVDHAGMLNVNVASSLRLPSNPNNAVFDELVPDYQRRGRRLTELLLDEVAHADDTLPPPGMNRTTSLIDYRSGDDHVQYDRDVLRRELVGGLTTGAAYYLYGLGDEASLRHRGILVPYDRRGDRSPAACVYCTVDRALPGSLLWSRRLVGSSYDWSVEPRWNRLNSNVEPPQATSPDYAAYEGYDDDIDGLGWRTLLQEDHPAAIRRPMFTTVSHEVVPPPTGLTFWDHGTPDDGSDDTVVLDKSPVDEPLSVYPVRFLDAIGLPGPDWFMAWPVLNREDFPDLADWMRVQPIDINMSLDTTDAGEAEGFRRQYITYLAAAMYFALDGVDSYQGIALDAAMDPYAPLNRQWLAWQFALNMADYRDSDSEPTILQWVFEDPGGPAEKSCTLFGLEKQPFFTEAYAHLIAGTDPDEPSSQNIPDAWYFAVELFIPPHWRISTDTLYLRSPGAPVSGLIPLNSFTLVLDGTTLPTILDGGTYGTYVVFCGDTSAAPVDLDTTPFYRNFDFEIDTDGYGRVELVYSPDISGANPRTHVLDVIGPTSSGGKLASNSQCGDGAWANRQTFQEGVHRGFSLLRSTKGWRFTTGWHVYTECGLMSQYIPPPCRRSLGAANETFDSLDDNIPESIWPAMVTTATANHEPQFLNAGGLFVDGFASGLPYEAFDSVGDISRMMMIGPVKYTGGIPDLPLLPPHFGIPGGVDFPVTAFIAQILDTDIPVGELPDDPEDRIAAGRVDFVLAKSPMGGFGTPWTWRLLNFLTTQSPLFDGINNDGDVDDLGDEIADFADPSEGADILYRVAGRININTAPLSVLRSVPYMSLLPTSAEYTAYVGLGGMPLTDPAGAYTANPMRFWDIAGAIVAQREGRPVPLRLLDGGTGWLTTVAIAHRHFAPQAGPFASVSELAKLNYIADNINADIDDVADGDHYGTGNRGLYRTDRFEANATIPLYNHKVLAADPDLGPSEVFSPDYRYRRYPSPTPAEDGIRDYVPITQPLAAASDPYDAGGIRGRDIFLARWANLLTTRSDVFTAYIALLDEDGNYVQRTRVTLDRSECFREVPVTTAAEKRIPVLPKILGRSDSSYTDDMR